MILWLIDIPATMEQKHIICTGTQLLKNTNTNFLMLSQKNQSKCSTSLTRET